MKSKALFFISFISTFSSIALFAQNNNPVNEPYSSNFFSDVRFGGGLGAGFGNSFSNVTIAPSAIKPITDQLSLGAGLQFNYMASKNIYSTTSYGANFLALYNPIPEMQLSVEIEQLRVNYKMDGYYSNGNYVPKYERDFWNTGLFLGAGYTAGNATVGIRYNVLFREKDYVYNQAWMPFVRVYF